MICSSDRRLAVEQMKNHSFFYGVDWDAIRQIDSPFVPRLRSITDTSYFPTEELQEVPDEPSGADTSGSNKDLAFLGYAIKQLTVVDAADCNIDTHSRGTRMSPAGCEVMAVVIVGNGIWITLWIVLLVVANVGLSIDLVSYAVRIR